MKSCYTRVQAKIDIFDNNMYKIIHIGHQI